MPELSIGCSGFSYPHWRGCFYPENLPPKRWFGYYCETFGSVELNVTFYRTLQPEVFARLRLESPPGFAFSAKGSRFITHIKRLANPEKPLARFYEGVLQLGKKLRVILWQFPPGFACNVALLEHFLKQLSRYPVRNALEFRDESWLCEEVFSLCRKSRVAICMADWPEFINEPPLTSDFVYLRRHGRGGNHNGCYSHDELSADAGRITGYLDGGREVFIYFNNDAEGFALANAMELAQLIPGYSSGHL